MTGLNLTELFGFQEERRQTASVNATRVDVHTPNLSASTMMDGDPRLGQGKGLMSVDHMHLTVIGH